METRAFPLKDPPPKHILKNIAEWQEHGCVPGLGVPLDPGTPDLPAGPGHSVRPLSDA